MGYTTFQIAKGFVRAGSGECDEARLGEIVNAIRRHLYNWYQEAQLFADVVESYVLQEFYGDQECFRGITLPREVAAIESMWVDHWPVKLNSSWREWQAGISPCSDCGLQKFDLPGFFSTFADIRPGRPKRLKFRCDDPADFGCALAIRGLTAAGAPFAQDFSLSTQLQMTTEWIGRINPQGGIIKGVTKGRVVLADEDDRILGIYEPDETVPSLRRVKITGAAHDCSVVNIRSARRYFPLIGPNDVVETDNEPAFDSMARYLRSYQRADRSIEDAKLEKDHLATAKQHILGDKAREMGKGTRTELKIVSPGIMPHRARLSSHLYGFPRRYL